MLGEWSLILGYVLHWRSNHGNEDGARKRPFDAPFAPHPPRFSWWLAGLVDRLFGRMWDRGIEKMPCLQGQTPSRPEPRRRKEKKRRKPWLISKELPHLAPNGFSMLTLHVHLSIYSGRSYETGLMGRCSCFKLFFFLFLFHFCLGMPLATYRQAFGCNCFYGGMIFFFFPQFLWRRGQIIWKHKKTKI